MRLSTLVQIVITLMKIFLFVFAGSASAIQEYAVYPSEQSQENANIVGKAVGQSLIKLTYKVSGCCDALVIQVEDKLA